MALVCNHDFREAKVGERETETRTSTLTVTLRQAIFVCKRCDVAVPEAEYHDVPLGYRFKWLKYFPPKGSDGMRRPYATGSTFVMNDQLLPVIDAPDALLIETAKNYRVQWELLQSTNKTKPSQSLKWFHSFQVDTVNGAAIYLELAKRGLMAHLGSDEPKQVGNLQALPATGISSYTFVASGFAQSGIANSPSISLDFGTKPSVPSIPMKPSIDVPKQESSAVRMFHQTAAGVRRIIIDDDDA